MKKRNKLLALVLVVILTCTGIFGCGKKTNSNDSNGSQTNGGPTEISFWCTYGTYGFNILASLVDEFNNSQDEYNVTMINNGSASDVRTKLMTTQQEYYPSLFCGTPTTISSYATVDYVKPISSFIESDEDKWTEGMYEVVKTAYSDLEGNMIGVPLGVSSAGYMVNVDILKAAGYSLEDVTNYEKMVEIARTATKKGLCKYGISYASGVDLLDMLTIQGVDFTDADNGYSGEPTKSLLLEGETGAAIKKAMELYASLYKDEIAYPFGSEGAGAGQGSFLAGDLLFWTCTNSYAHNVIDAKPDFEWAFIPSVGVDANAKYMGNAICEGTGLFICDTGNEAEMQGAYDFIKFLASPEKQIDWCKQLGYVPYTEKAANDSGYVEWMEANFPSAKTVTQMLLKNPEGFGLPYVGIGNELLTANYNLFSAVGADPNGDVDGYIEEAASRIDEALQIMALRNK